MGDPADTRATLDSLLGQDRPPEEIIVLDNSPEPLHRAAAGRPGVTYLHPGRNLGFAQGVNLAAGRASGDLLLLLNPDARVGPGCLAVLAAALEDDPGAAIAGAQVMLPDGRVNAGDNPVHLAGFCWSGNYLGPPESGPPRETLAVSGAALMVQAADFRALGGFHPEIFMYFEDSDLCWRARIAGRRVLFCPEARVVHEYEFEKGARKWGWLEQGRTAAVLGNFEPRTLLLLAPLLLAAEVAVWMLALRAGWAREKAWAWRRLWRGRRSIREMRSGVRTSRRVPDRELLREFSRSLESPALGARGRKLVRLPQELYGRAVLRLLAGREGV